MSRNFALLQIVGKEQEYFQPSDETPSPELVAVPTPAEDPKKSITDSVTRSLLDRPLRDQPLHDQSLFDQPLFDHQPLRFEMETWQLEELTKLVRGVFLEHGVESDRVVSKKTVVLASSESGNGWSQLTSPRTSGPSGSDAATSPDGSGRRPRTSRAVRQTFVAIR